MSHSPGWPVVAGCTQEASIPYCVDPGLFEIPHNMTAGFSQNGWEFTFCDQNLETTHCHFCSDSQVFLLWEGTCRGALMPDSKTRMGALRRDLGHGLPLELCEQNNVDTHIHLLRWRKKTPPRKEYTCVCTHTYMCTHTHPHTNVSRIKE